MIKKIISGGQTGVDQAALQVAIDLGLDHGGWCPPGRVCEKGKIPERFKLKETPADRSEKAPEVPRSLRTEWNVRDSDGTLVLVPKADGAGLGTQFTVQAALSLNKPHMIIEMKENVSPEKVMEWISENHIKILNVAGPAEGRVETAYDFTYQLLERVISKKV